MVPGIVASLHWRRAQSRAPHHLILLDVVLTTGARALAAPTHRVVPCEEAKPRIRELQHRRSSRERHVGVEHAACSPRGCDRARGAGRRRPRRARAARARRGRGRGRAARAGRTACEDARTRETLFKIHVYTLHQHGYPHTARARAAACRERDGRCAVARGRGQRGSGRRAGRRTARAPSSPAAAVARYERRALAIYSSRTRAARIDRCAGAHHER